MSEGARGDLELGTIPRLVGIAAARHGERTAIEDRGRALTYRGLDALVRRAARGLMASGVGRGDRVAVWAPNRWEWVVAALATHAVGGVLVPLNTRFKGGEAAWILARSEARALFTVREFLGQDYLAMLAGESLPALEMRVLFDGEAAGARRWNAFSWKGSAFRTTTRGSAPRRSRRTTSQICSSRRGRRASRRGSCARTRRRSARSATGVRSRGCGPGTATSLSRRSSTALDTRPGGSRHS